MLSRPKRSRRVILPGIVLAAGVHPLVSTLAPTINSLYGVGASVSLIAEVIFFGLIASSATQWIYYVYEGFRLQSLTTLARNTNERRVRQLDELMNEPPAEEASSSTARVSQHSLRGTCRIFLFANAAMKPRNTLPERFRRALATSSPPTSFTRKRGTASTSIFYWFNLLNFASDTSRKEFADQVCISRKPRT